MVRNSTRFPLGENLLIPLHNSTDLERIPPTWPGRDRSQFVLCDGIRWHLQQHGEGPVTLLVHGTGGSTHSWALCTRALRATSTVVVIDLPGHGFTHVPESIDRARNVYSIDGMARELGALLRQLGIAPIRAAGHSAGVPVLIQLALDGAIAPEFILGCNPALVAPPTLYTMLIAPMVAAVVERGFVARTGAQLAQASRVVELMLSSSGTTLDAEALARYRLLCEQPEHVHAALTMMSRWDLPRLMRDAVSLTTPLHLIGGKRDRWVPPGPLTRAVERLPSARLEMVEAGHLLPEEMPSVVIRAMSDG